MAPLKDCVVSPVYPEVDREDCIPFPDFEESMRDYEEELERELIGASDVETRREERGRKRRSECISENAEESIEEEGREGKRRRTRSF